MFEMFNKLSSELDVDLRLLMIYALRISETETENNGSEIEKVEVVVAYVFVDDVADGGAGVVHCSSEERDKRSVMHVYLVDLVEDLVDQTRIHHVLRLHRNHVFLKQVQRSSLDHAATGKQARSRGSLASTEYNLQLYIQYCQNA